MKNEHTQIKVENKEKVKKDEKGNELQNFMNSVVTEKQNKIHQKNKEELHKQVPTKENVVKSVL